MLKQSLINVITGNGFAEICLGNQLDCNISKKKTNILFTKCMFFTFCKLLVFPIRQFKNQKLVLVGNFMREQVFDGNLCLIIMFRVSKTNTKLLVYAYVVFYVTERLLNTSFKVKTRKVLVANCRATEAIFIIYNH